MVVMLCTALLMYRLFRPFGPFHVGAVVSALTLAAGFVPALLCRPCGQWVVMHYADMSWS